MNALLDDVWREYGDYIRKGNIPALCRIDLDTEAGQRLAAEEFLARHAEAMSLRLTWAWDNEETGRFRQFLNRARKILAPVLPKSYLAYTSDARMARMFAYALRPLQYSAENYAGQGAGGDRSTAGEEVRLSQVRQVKKLDHSRYQENTMLSREAKIPVIEIQPTFHTVSEAENVLSEKIRTGGGRIDVVNVDQDMPVQIRTNGSLDEAASERALIESMSDGTPAEIHAAALLNVEKLLETAKLATSHRDWHTFAKNQQNGTNKETALQIHRFYSAMKCGDDLYGVKMTVREKRSGKNLFYTLETHDLDIQKISPATDGHRGGVVKAALPVQSPDIEFSAFFEKFKPVDDLLGFKYK
ncbi:MAG: hypothetical protein IJJ28_07385 [Lentisphaeria bacterium]|nr:hypothetical protein [Lentisphaeria bacterium]